MIPITRVPARRTTSPVFALLPLLLLMAAGLGACGDGFDPASLLDESGQCLLGEPQAPVATADLPDCKGAADGASTLQAAEASCAPGQAGCTVCVSVRRGQSYGVAVDCPYAYTVFESACRCGGWETYDNL